MATTRPLPEAALLLALLLQFLGPRPTMSWFTANTVSRAVPDNVRLLILPGFGNDSGDYFLEKAPQGSLVCSLKKRGWRDDQISVLSTKRTDWLQVFLNGALDLDFWLARAPPTRPAFAWYLNRIAASIDELTDNQDDVAVVLIGHSAGGWLARAALGFGSCTSTGRPENNTYGAAISLDCVLGMVTLGTPHLPPPPEVMDMTRGALRITHEQFPGAHHDGLFYITAIGNAIQGVKQERKTPFESTDMAGFAFESYQAVCGEGDAVGDGVVPQSAGHLDGALQLDLDGIFHSIGTPDRWYGSDSVMDLWYDDMMQQIEDSLRRRKSQRTLLTSPFDALFR